MKELLCECGEKYREILKAVDPIGAAITNIARVSVTFTCDKHGPVTVDGRRVPAPVTPVQTTRFRGVGR